MEAKIPSQFKPIKHVRFSEIPGAGGLQAIIVEEIRHLNMDKVKEIIPKQYNGVTCFELICDNSVTYYVVFV